MAGFLDRLMDAIDKANSTEVFGDYDLGDIIKYGTGANWLMGESSPLFRKLSGEDATKDAAKAQQDAMKKAFDAIQAGGAEARSYQKPYLENAAEDYGQLRDLVQSGHFVQPYGRSFTSQSYAPQGFSFNPAGGKASFASWQPQGGPATFTPQALPALPARPAKPPVTASTDDVVGKYAARTTPMVRPNLNIPPSISELVMDKAMEQVKSGTVQNPPAGVDFHDPRTAARNPYATGGNPKDMPYSPGNLSGNKSLSIAELVAIARQGRMPGPAGSGTFIPTYGRT